MNSFHPTVRYLIVCEDVINDDADPRRISLLGLISVIRGLETPAYPLLYRELCVFLEVTECRGPAAGWIELQNADTGEIVFRTRSRTIPFVNDPLEIIGVTFRIRNVLFSEPGLHRVQFWYNEQKVAEQALLLR